MSSILTIIRQRRYRRNRARSSAQQRSQRAVIGFGFAASALLVVLVLVASLTYVSLTNGLPSIDNMAVLMDPYNGQLLQPTRLYDRTSKHLIAVLSPTDTTRLYIPYSLLPQGLVEATLALDQPDFWTSQGYVISGWEDADVHPTLAQDLVYNLLLWNSPPSSMRGIHERILAGQLTARYGRQQVLEWYMNSTYYGYYAYGVEVASWYYFGKSVTQLNLSEDAMLAAIGHAPALNPIDAPAVAEQHRIAALMMMQALGFITADQASQAIAQPPTIIANPPPQIADIAPAFVKIVLSQLDSKFGAGRVERGGLVIRTSLDYDLQLQSLCAAQTYLARMRGETIDIAAADGSTCEAARLLPALMSDTSYPDTTASAVLLDPQTGQILAAVGDLTGEDQGSLLVYHPAGTSITPFIYLTGFSRGLSPASLAWDIPAGVPEISQEYHGPIRTRIAMTNDYLPPAISVMTQMGVESVRGIAAPFGLDLPSGMLVDDFDVSPLALAEAYSIFANDGTQTGQPISEQGLQPTAVLQATGVDHSVWVDWTTPRTQSVVSEQLAYLMNHVLTDEIARWPSLGHPNSLEIGRPAGAKLSHTLDMSGGWTIGYTPQRLLTVWFSAGSGSDSSLRSADLWHALMQYAVRDLPSESWAMPSGIVTVPVCDPSGLLPTAACPNVVNEVFLDGRQPIQVDNLYQIFQVNRETGLLATVFTPPDLVEARTYMVLPSQAKSWATLEGIQSPPTSYDTLQIPPVLPDVHITTPGMFSIKRGKINILGTASGEDFAFYRLEFGQGLYPQEWTQLGTDSTTPVSEGKLGEWDTTGLDGLFALRLMVVHTDQRLEQAVLQVTLDNTAPQVAVSYPQQGQEIDLSQEPKVALQAQVNDPFLADVKFYVDGVLVGNTDLSPFGVIWDARIGPHHLRVVAMDKAGNSTEVTVDFSVK